jgi:hypothetical protein
LILLDGLGNKMDEFESDFSR